MSEEEKKVYHKKIEQLNNAIDILCAKQFYNNYYRRYLHGRNSG